MIKFREQTVINEPNISEGAMLLTLYKYQSSNNRDLKTSNGIQLIRNFGNYFR